jgi:uncharacterized protein YggU (UPF0235/DUF167 family)
MPMRISVRVRPGAARTAVGGSYAAADRVALVVAVTARAVDGAANEAVVAAVADAFGLRKRDVTLVAGGRSRSKVLELAGEEPALQGRLRSLLNAT